ncbi:MAG: DUF3108 domain-containing protein [Bradymonadales bacterium]|nr:DUF3108 domain-containing protein [Bradymonadales bacterium]
MQPNEKRIRYLVCGLLLVAVCGYRSGAWAQDDRSVARYRGEELYYAIELFGTQLAEGALVVGDFVHQEGEDFLPVYGLAVTEGVAALVYPMRDEGNTLVRLDTGIAATTVKLLNERNFRRRYQVDFLPDEFKARVSRTRDEQVDHYDRYLPSDTHDAFSWVYAVREQDLTPGTTAVYYMYDGWKLSRITTTVLPEPDTLLVGEEFIDCRRLSLVRDVMDTIRPVPMIEETAALPPVRWVRPDAGGEQVGVLWISDDYRRIPVQIDFHNALVTAVARLIRYQPPVDGY